jgi:hypothetical protein
MASTGVLEVFGVMRRQSSNARMRNAAMRAPVQGELGSVLHDLPFAA